MKQRHFATRSPAHSGSRRGMGIYGIHAVAALLSRRPEQVSRLYVLDRPQNARVEALGATARALGVPVIPAGRRDLDRLAGAGAVHQGVLAEAQALREHNEAELEALLVAVQRPLFLVLEAVQDPHNLGACLRAADGAGVTAVVVPARHCARLSPTVWKTSSGAVEQVPVVRVASLNKALTTLASGGVQLVGLSASGGARYHAVDLRGPSALVFGTESTGLRPGTRRLCHRLASIPMAGLGESLNLSVAAGVCLYEAVRQRSHSPGSVIAAADEQ